MTAEWNPFSAVCLFMIVAKYASVAYGGASGCLVVKSQVSLHALALKPKGLSDVGNVLSPPLMGLLLLAGGKMVLI